MIKKYRNYKKMFKKDKRKGKVTKMNIIEFSDYGDSSTDCQTTSIFTNLRVGLCHLF